MELNPEFLVGVFGKATETRVGQDLIVLGVVWLMMRKKVSKHFSMLETGLMKVASSLDDLKETVSNDLKAHSDRLLQIEQRVTKLETIPKGE